MPSKTHCKYTMQLYIASTQFKYVVGTEDGTKNIRILYMCGPLSDKNNIRLEQPRLVSLNWNRTQCVYLWQYHLSNVARSVRTEIEHNAFIFGSTICRMQLDRSKLKQNTMCLPLVVPFVECNQIGPNWNRTVIDTPNFRE